MTRLLLRLFNAPAIVLLAVFGVAIQTSFFSFWILEYFQPDIILLLVIWCALRRDFTEGGIITLIIANIAEIHSASPSGLLLISYMAVYLTLRGAARIFVIPDLSSFVFVTMMVTVFSKSVNMITLKLLGASGAQVQSMILFIFPAAIVNGALANWLFRWLERFDWITFKNVEAERALEDELHLESPGQ